MQTPLNWREIAFNSVPVAAVKKVSNVNEVREGCDHYLKYSPNYVYCDAFMCIAFIYIYIYIYISFSGARSKRKDVVWCACELQGLQQLFHTHARRV